MAPPASAIVAAERRVVQSHSELRDDWRHLRRRLSRPSSLAAAAAIGALVGFTLKQRGRADTVAGTLATALIRHVLKQGTQQSRRSSPARS
jgi:hypothetical protein